MAERAGCEFLFADIAYQLAKPDHLVFVAAFEHALRHEQAARFPLLILHVLPGDERSGAQKWAIKRSHSSISGGSRPSGENAESVTASLMLAIW